MALGSLVKEIYVRIKTDGAEQAKADLAAIAAEARAVGDASTSSAFKLDALRVELRALKRDGRDLGDIQSRIRAVGDAATNSAVKLAALRLALRAVNDAGGGGGGILGILSKLFGGGGGSGGFGGGIPGIGGALKALTGPAGLGSVGGGLAGFAGLAGIVNLVGGMIQALTAAGMGIAAFGALAMPTFTRIIALLARPVAPVIQAGGRGGLPFGTVGTGSSSPLALIVDQIRGIESMFGQLALKLQPLVLKITSVGLDIAKKLLPALLPFAKTAGDALLTLARGFDRFVSSPGFKAFLSEMRKLSGPAIVAIGTSLGKLAVAIGKLLLSFSGRVGVQALTTIIDTLAAVTTAVAWAVRRWNANFATGLHGIKTFVQSVRVAFDLMIRGFEIAGSAIARFFTVDIPKWINEAVTWFNNLTTRVLAALAGLPGKLFSMGVNAVQGFINGLMSKIPGVGSASSSIVSGFLGAWHVFGFGSPSRLMRQYGVWIGEGLIDGLLGTTAQARAASQKISGILLAEFQKLRQYAAGIASSMEQFAALSAGGPGITGYRPGRPGYTSYTALGVPVVHPAVAAQGTAPPTGRSILSSLRTDLGRLRAFAHVLKRLQQMGLDRTLMAQIIAAGPDTGYQIAEAILDAGRGEIRSLDRTEAGIIGTSRRIAGIATRSQFGGIGPVNVYIGNGMLFGTPAQLAKEIRKILLELKRQHGGQALGLG